MTIEMPVPHTPLYIGLARFVAKLLGEIVQARPAQIEDRATQLSGRAAELAELVEACRGALQARFGQGNWTGSAADSGRGMIEGLLEQLTERARKAEEEAAALRMIAKLLKAVQDYYTQQATIAEHLIRRLMRNPFSRPLAQLMAMMMAFQLAEIIGQFRSALSLVDVQQFSPLWSSADQAYRYTPTHIGSGR